MGPVVLRVDYDAIVLGSGQAGNPLAVRLAGEGWKVALVERDQFGGTCVNVGCTPTKTLAHRAQIAYYAKNSRRWGVESSNVSVDFNAVMAQKSKMVKDWREGVRKELLDNPGIEVICAEAAFDGPRTIEVQGQRITASKIFINTGASPAIPPIPGLSDSPFLTNETILELTELPESLIVIGGGYIGLEFGQMFARFGSRVSVIQNGPQLVPREDPEIAEDLQKALSAEQIKIVLNTAVNRVQFDGTFRVDIEGGSLESSHLLIATGRSPRTASLNLDSAGIQLDARGAIKVNDRLETTAEGVWALGDVNGGPAFTHISYNDYQIVAANVLENAGRSTSDRMVPYCMFTDPQLGGFGMTEGQARKAGRRLKIGMFKMSDVARAVERDEVAGRMKLVVDADSDQVLGGTVLCVEGGEVLQILSTLAYLKQPYTALNDAIWIHPTLAEGIFGLIASVKAAN